MSMGHDDKTIPLVKGVKVEDAKEKDKSICVTICILTLSIPALIGA